MAWIRGTEYFWVVLCKNRGAHNKYNLYSRHAIPLAETDGISPSPKVDDFTVRCDDCGQEYTYGAKDILRAELDPPEFFTPHPLFPDSTPSSAVTASDSAHSSAAPTPGKTSVLERIRSKVVPYLRFRHKESPPPPRWRRPPQEK